MPCKLHCIRPNAAGSAIDENTHAALDVSLTEKLQGSISANRNSSSLLERHVLRLERNAAGLGQAFVFRIRAETDTAGCINGIPGLESSNAAARGFDHAG